MFPILAFLFLTVPIAELALFMTLGGEIGVLNTLLIVAFTGIVGAALARQQGVRVLTELQQTLGRGDLPADGLLQGAFVLVGGVLLLTPGFLTDAFGFACLLPPTRAAMAAGLKAWASKAIEQGTLQAERQAGGFRAGGFRMHVGGVQPGATRQERTLDPAGDRPPAPPGGGRTIDADFRLIPDED